ncbi:hypothetical protein SUGI_1481620 [Cryptomeria japonica]|uniref:Uncharacterized protein n=1 Tax=Cryptomeria japonica TaxID=3369 RepID=A0AAD3NT11_CRYJA|nr:hypothetical protein SUGI_1479610 [Cryptomeria japonica]GLJ58876.1 hypothetical protein SUGI_1481620 [Cryptomeria japonica]
MGYYDGDYGKTTMMRRKVAEQQWSFSTGSNPGDLGKQAAGPRGHPERRRMDSSLRRIDSSLEKDRFVSREGWIRLSASTIRLSRRIRALYSPHPSLYYSTHPGMGGGYLDRKVRLFFERQPPQ